MNEQRVDRGRVAESSGAQKSGDCNVVGKVDQGRKAQGHQQDGAPAEYPITRRSYYRVELDRAVKHIMLRGRG